MERDEFDDRPDRVTIVKESSGGWMVVVLLALLVIGGFFAMQYIDRNAAKNNAVADAAQSVGKAANDVGEAARKVAP